MTASTPLSALLASIVQDGAQLRVEVPEDWSQGRSVFGGLQGALALRAMRSLVPAGVPIRTLQATLIAPSTGHFEIDVQVLRSGKNATHVEARIKDRGTLCAVVIGVFGAKLSSVVAVKPVQPAVSTAQAVAMPFVPGVVPNFAQHFQSRLLRGAFPFTGTEVTDCVFEVDLKDEGGADECSVVAVADFPPPLALSHLKRPSPGSTLTWMLEFLTDDFHSVPLQGFRVDVTLLAALDGYTQQSAMVWSADGSPLAIGRQTMLVFG